MKTTSYILSILIGFSSILFSCSSPEEESLPWYDFGEKTYDEPFVGLLKSRPEILVKSMQYPPFSWVSSDTVKLKKEFDITFNEECIRSKSKALIQIRNFSNEPIKEIALYVNGKQCSNGEFEIEADSTSKKILLDLVISPSAGEITYNGLVLIQGDELDKVNEVNLQQENNVIANWTAKQEIGWPILLWLFWIITALLIIVLVGLILYCLYKLLLILLSNFKSLYSSSNTPLKRTEQKNHNSRKGNKVDEDNEEDMWKILCRNYPEQKNRIMRIKNSVDNLCKKNSFFLPDMFIAEQKSNGFYIKYVRDMGANANTTIFVGRDGVIKATSAKKAAGRGLNGTNEFLMNLLPNQKYIVDNSIYMVTDGNGRIVESKANISELIKGTKGPRNPNVQKIFTAQGGYGYEGGHLHSHAQGGPDEIEVAMHYKINHDSRWRNCEDEEAIAAKAGEKVFSLIKLKYKGRSNVPSKFIKISTINGNTRKLICNNKLGKIL